MFQRKVFQNAKWIIGCKIIQAALHFVVGMLSARYLGPSNYGLISYAASIVSFAIPIMQLGMRSTLVQEIITDPDKEGEILGTALVMNVVSSIACMIGVFSFAAIVNRGEKDTIIICAIYSVSLFFQAFEMIQYWFQAKFLSKYPSMAMLGAYFAVSAYKIYLLAAGKSVFWFALSYSIDFVIIDIALFLVYKKMGRQKFVFSASRVKSLFNRSKHYIVSSLMVTVFANTDHVMLKLMIGEIENGYYTAAVTTAGVANFVYAAIIDSFRPAILSSKRENQTEFENNVSNLYGLIIYTALAQGLVFTIGAGPIIKLLYGSEYLSAVPVLRIVVWYIVFSYLGTIRNVWILAENKQRYLWMINLSGALMNVVLNALLIPLCGACGAAVASVITQFFTNVIVGAIIKPIRYNNTLMRRGLNPGIFLEVFQKILLKRKKTQSK